jgi:hypothetical protein
MAYKYTAYTPSAKVTQAEKENQKLRYYYTQNYGTNKYQVGDGGFGKQYNTANNRLNKLYNNNTLPQQFAYTKQGEVNKAVSDITNRKPFSYNMDEDVLFQQAKKQYQAMGKTAMMDTIGQASSLTGGYGNSYATTAGAQAYNGYLQQLNASVGDYYAMALSGYNAETDRLNGVYNVLSADRAQEHSEWAGNWDNYNNLYALYQNDRDIALNADMNAYQNNASNAYNSANLASNNYNTLASNDMSIWSTQENMKAEQSSQQETERSNKVMESRYGKTGGDDEGEDDVPPTKAKRTQKTSEIIEKLNRNMMNRGWVDSNAHKSQREGFLIKKLTDLLVSEDISDEELTYLEDYYNVEI